MLHEISRRQGFRSRKENQSRTARKTPKARILRYYYIVPGLIARNDRGSFDNSDGHACARVYIFKRRQFRRRQPASYRVLESRRAVHPRSIRPFDSRASAMVSRARA